MKKLLGISSLLLVAMLIGCQRPVKMDKVLIPVNYEADLYVINEIGKVELSKANNDELSIETAITIDSKDNSVKKDIIDNVIILAKEEENQITLGAYAKNDITTSIWDWAKKKYDSVNISVQYTIRVPDKVKAINVRNNIGDIRAKNIKGDLDLLTDIGSIDLSNISVSEHSFIQSNVGSIDFDVDSFTNTKDLNVYTGVGDINLSIPKDTSYNLLGTDSDQEEDTQADNHAVNIRLSAGIGSAKLNGKKIS
ncbi:hypothetical protein [Clostridium thermarum]|uniref:hypothetical protein n=1 Tax=Clostridium thermarum TaxID=1716543 RepID=UPI00111ECB96|nr:hypothetical protein [Clostridium thermarum]